MWKVALIYLQQIAVTFAESHADIFDLRKMAHYDNILYNTTAVYDTLNSTAFVVFDDDVIRFQRLFKRILWWYVLVAACIGILLNIYCVMVLVKIREHHAHFTMLTIAVADLCDLFLILMPHIGAMVISRRNLFTAAFCKIHTFLLHSFSAYSIWCWVLLSIIRYLAVFHPYKHLRFQACSVKYGLLVALLVCMSVEGWVPILVTADNGYCSLDIDLISVAGFQNTNLFEVVLTYVLPFICIACTNVAVFGRIYVCSDASGLQRLRADSLVGVANVHVGQSAAIFSASREKKLRQQRFNSLTRLIVIVTVSLVLNLPNCVIRLLNSFDPVGSWLPEPYNDALQRISYALSYTHFAINCIYLRLVVNGRSASRTSYSRRCSEDTGIRYCSTERRPSRVSISYHYWSKAPIVVVTCDDDSTLAKSVA